ncbi:MAG: esterase-like activity of phytase family protein [Acidobacteriota bacterium]
MGLAAAAPLFWGAAPSGGARVAGTFVLPEIGLGAFQNAELPGSITDDRGLLLGSVGSDLCRSPTDPPGIFWMTTDRGPNPLVKKKKEERRTFPVPAFTPHILKVRAVDGRLEILDARPLVGASGRPVTGLPNLEGRDEAPYDEKGKTRIPVNGSGLDPEGLARMADGSFWISEEYAPSVARVDASGKVAARIVPVGLGLRGADYEVDEVLPAILLDRRPNRGFEALALASDGKTLYAGLQSPLLHPGERASESSRTTRILALEAATGRPLGEYAYALDTAPGPKREPLMLSALTALPGGGLLALERPDDDARVYRLDVSRATDMLGSRWDLPSTRPSFESIDELATKDVSPIAKELVVDLGNLPGVPGKIEGLTVVDSRTIAIANDNDFGIAEGLGPKGARANPSVLVLVELPEELGAREQKPPRGSPSDQK